MSDQKEFAEQVTAEIYQKRCATLEQELRDAQAKAMGSEAACRLKDLFLARAEVRYWREVYNHSSFRLEHALNEVKRCEEINCGK